MNIRTEIREIEKHINSMTADRITKIHIISKAQSLTKDEHSITVLAIVKKRIMRS